MDVQSEYVESTMNQTTAVSTPAGEVDSLIQMVAEENGLELGAELGRIVPSKVVPSVQEANATEEQVGLPFLSSGILIIRMNLLHASQSWNLSCGVMEQGYFVILHSKFTL